MEKHLTSISIILTLVVVFSCNPSQRETKQVEKENPEPLQSEEIVTSSFRGQHDITQELYDYLVSKNVALQQLEKDIENFNSNEASEKYAKYDNKSSNYYTSAGNNITSIEDSLLKKRISFLITSSKNKYQNRTHELQSILKHISQKNLTLHDHHTALKIILTLPLIEKYQKDNIPDKNEFNLLDAEQQKLIKRIDSVTPKY
ncbi:hypothetical protein [Flectobacillus roseus]|uniref:NDxxF motif lipoprotein n=1 Tax=Flectobacillus roseus TaxID=502259 RepID=A0ABT6YFB8_9BACT|nr:hypothetical protein [Flectobacillus roseus]MDI9862294.1 hypothetical protein [Flectobacillus roseus]MDI9871911.1 hypothetical protein [Flectobacillus roseus]